MSNKKRCIEKGKRSRRSELTFFITAIMLIGTIGSAIWDTQKQASAGKSSLSLSTQSYTNSSQSLSRPRQWLYETRNRDINNDEMDIPTWSIGDEWIYEGDVYFEGENGSFDGIIEDLTNTVVELTNVTQNDTYPVYIVNVSGNISGDITYEWISGYLEGDINGSMLLRQSDLAIIKTDMNSTGTVEKWPITLDYETNATTTFDPSLENYDFPLDVGEIWEIACNVSSEGTFYLEDVIDESFSESEWINVTSECLGIENVSVPAGTFESFHIYVENNGSINYWYSPNVKNVVKSDINMTTENSILNLKMNLTSYSLSIQPINVTEEINPSKAPVGSEVNISGRAINSSSGDPISGGDVLIEIPSTGDEWETITNETGYYYIEVAVPSITDDTPSTADLGSDGVIVTVSSNPLEGYKVKILAIVYYVYVDDNFEDDPTNHTWNTIQEGIDDAIDGCTVYVFNGTYYENVIVDKTINLIGENRNTTIIDGNETGDVINITVDQVNMGGFTVKNGGEYPNVGIRIYQSCYTTIHECNITSNNWDWEGIHLDSSSNNTIENSILSRNDHAIGLEYSNNNNIIKNKIITNDWYGIWIRSQSNNNLIFNNTILDNEYGIYLSSSSNNNIISYCNVYNNDVGIYFLTASNNNITNCICYSNSEGIDLELSLNNAISNCAIYNNSYGGICLFDSSNNEIKDCIIYNNSNGDGIYLGSSSSNLIINCICYNNNYNILLEVLPKNNVVNCICYNADSVGIGLGPSSNNTIMNCTIYNNPYGFDLSGSNNTILNCDIYNNSDYGLHITSDSVDNIIYHNNFINNSQNACDEGNNKWDNGYPSGGNYWSDYEREDNYQGENQDIPGSDGIGDIPYNISGDNNQDRYPLMYPVGTPDNVPPISYVIDISPYWHTETEVPFEINAIASDNISRIAYVELWYRYSTDNSSWNDWTLFGVDNATPWSWSFDTPDNDGYYQFYSIANDTAGNEEDAPAMPDAITGIDTVLPETIHTLSGTSGNAGWYISSVVVTLTASDAISGVDATYYRINSGSWQEYTDTFVVAGDGIYTIEYYSVDNAGNVESTNSISFKIDKTDPVTTPSLSGMMGENDWYVSDVEITLDATDSTSGVDYTKYRIDGGSWRTYTSKFTVSSDGEHTVSYYSVDNAGNEEPKKSVSFKIDKTPPETTFELGPPDGKHGWYVSDVMIILNATDATSGVKETKYRIDNGSWNIYTTSSIVGGDGEHAIEYYSIDNAGNKESIKSVEFKIDQTDPSLEIITPEEGYLYIFGRKIIPFSRTIIIGKITIVANAMDETSGVVKVGFIIDGTEYEDTIPPWEYEYTEKSWIPSTHTLAIKAYDEAGNTATTDEIDFTKWI